MMSAIGKAIGPLVNIALLLLFAIIIFAIIGLEFYAGALNKTCYDLSDLSKSFFEFETKKEPFSLKFAFKSRFKINVLICMQIALFLLCYRV